MTGLKSCMVTVFVLMLASIQLQGTVAQTRHVVGDGLGWTIPPGGEVAYTNWASRQTFRVGDVLVFNFTTGLHDVAEVSQAAYAPCTTSNPISLTPNGPANLTLTAPGTHYYICTFGTHCQIGQKLTINVSAATTTNPSAPAPTPTTRPAAPTPAPISSPTASTPTPAPTPSTTIPPPISSPAPSPVEASSPSPSTSTPSPSGGVAPPTVSTTTPSPSDSTIPPPPQDSAATAFASVVPVTFLGIALAFFLLDRLD